MVDRHNPQGYQGGVAVSFNLVIEILMVDRYRSHLIADRGGTSFNLVIEILMVDRGTPTDPTDDVTLFQSRNRDSYG